MNDDIDPWGKRDKIQQKGGSTHVSSLHKSPLDAYTDHQSGHAFTCQPSQRSSFDDSFSETFNPFLSLNGTCINPISVSFVGEGLFKPEQDEEVEEATDIETTLIQQSMHHIQSIFVQRQLKLEVQSLSNHSTSDEKQRSPPRRLRVFQEITSNLDSVSIATGKKVGDQKHALN